MIMTKSDPRTTPVIVSAVRTPIGRFLGGLSPLTAPELGGDRHPRGGGALRGAARRTWRR